MTICLFILLNPSVCSSSGVETVCEVIEVEDLTSVGSQSVLSKLITTESSNEEKLCVIEEIVLVSPSFYGSVGTEGEKMINESLEEVVLVEEVAKLDQEIGVEQRTEFLDIEPQEILNMEYGVVDDDDEVINEGKADPEISKPVSQESNMIQETGPEVNKEEKDMELGREASLKRMSRCRSLPVSRNSRLMGDSLVQQLVPGVVFPSSSKMGLEKANKSGTVLVSCVGSNNAQETTEAITDSDKEARLEMRSPSFRSDLRDKERSGESTDITTLLCQDKTETSYEAAIDVEEKTVMLKRTETTEERRGFELSLGLSLKHNESSEAENSFNETKSLGDNFLDKKQLFQELQANSFETPIVSCMGSNRTQETTEARIESHKEAVLEMRSPSFGHNHRIEEKSDESTEKMSLLSQDKTATYEATIDVEEKNVMLNRSETEKTRGFELSLGLSMNPSFKDSKGSEDNLPDKKASLGSMKGRARKRSKSSLLGTCLCCATVMN